MDYFDFVIIGLIFKSLYIHFYLKKFFLMQTLAFIQTKYTIKLLDDRSNICLMEYMSILYLSLCIPFCKLHLYFKKV